MVVNKFDIQYN